jgi:ADP-heptose:LPS heptosyltransferase
MSIYNSFKLYKNFKNYYTLKEIIKDLLDYNIYILNMPLYLLNSLLWKKYQKKFKIKNILLIYWGAIGDVIYATSVLNPLKNRYPDAKISFITNKNGKTIFTALANEIIEFDKSKENLLKFIKNLRNRKFDIVLNLKFDSDRAALITILSRSKFKVGCGPRHWLLFYNLKGKPALTITHQIERFSNILNAIGINEKISPSIYIDKESENFASKFWKEKRLKNKKVIMIHPGAKEEYKRWRIENFKELIKLLLKNYNFKILIAYGPYEKDLILKLKKELKNNKNIIIAPETKDIIKFAAILARCNYFIGNCSAPMTVAVALKIPSFIIMGPNNPVVWSPYGEIHKFILPKIRCKKCHLPCKKNYLCQTSIKFEDVFNLIKYNLVVHP